MFTYPYHEFIRPTTLSAEGIAEGFNGICKGTYFFHHDCWYTSMTDGTYCSANAEVFLLAMQYITLMEDVSFRTLKYDAAKVDYNDFVNFARNYIHPQSVDELLSIAGRKNPANFDLYTSPNYKRSEVDILACKLICRHAGEMNYIYDAQGDLTVLLLLDILDVISSGKVEFCADADKFLSLIRDIATSRVLTVIKSKVDFTMSDINSYNTFRPKKHSDADSAAEFTSAAEGF